MSEEVGKHKGAVETLLHEQKELSRLLKIVQGQLERHLDALEEAGVDTDEFIQGLQTGQQREGQQNEEQQRTQDRERSGSQADSPRAEEAPDEDEVDDFLEGDEDEDFAPF